MNELDGEMEVEYPTRTKQKKAESESYAILCYKLRELGIFRNQTDSDYGLDFEIEIVDGDVVKGQYFKAQVKASKNLYVRADDVATVGGIKETTLNYWCELSFKTHVIAYAVDLSNEYIYISLPLFWQASKLIEGTETSKTIEFEPNKNGEIDPIKKLTRKYALSPSVPDILYAHATILRRLPPLLELYSDIENEDSCMAVNEPELFQTFVELSRILLWDKLEQLKFSGHVERYWKIDFGRDKPDFSEMMNNDAKELMDCVLPLLIEELKVLKQKILDATFYWSYQNRSYLSLVHKTPLPEKVDEDTLSNWGENFNPDKWRPNKQISQLIEDSRKKQEEERKKKREEREKKEKK